MGDVKKLCMPKYSLSVMLFCGIRVIFTIITIFARGYVKEDTSAILLYVKNRYNSHFIDKTVKDVKNISCSLCHVILWHRSQFCYNNHFARG